MIAATTEYEELIRQIIEDSRTVNPVNFLLNAVRDISVKTINAAIKKDESIIGTRSLVSGNPDGHILCIRESIPKDRDTGDIIDCFDPENYYCDEYLKAAFEYMNIDTDDMIWIHAVPFVTKTEIGKKTIYRAPSVEEIEASSAYLEYAITALRPTVIIPIGNVAVNLFQKTNIEDIHGKKIRIRNSVGFPIYSPEFLRQLRGSEKADVFSSYEDCFYQDLENISEYLYGIRENT